MCRTLLAEIRYVTDDLPLIQWPVFSIVQMHTPFVFIERLAPLPCCRIGWPRSADSREKWYFAIIERVKGLGTRKKRTSSLPLTRYQTLYKYHNVRPFWSSCCSLDFTQMLGSVKFLVIAIFFFAAVIDAGSYHRQSIANTNPLEKRELDHPCFRCPSDELKNECATKCAALDKSSEGKPKISPVCYQGACYCGFRFPGHWSLFLITSPSFIVSSAYIQLGHYIKVYIHLNNRHLSWYLAFLFIFSWLSFCTIISSLHDRVVMLIQRRSLT